MRPDRHPAQMGEPADGREPCGIRRFKKRHFFDARIRGHQLEVLDPIVLMGHLCARQVLADCFMQAQPVQGFALNFRGKV